MQNLYKPVSCDLYDQLTQSVVLRKRVELEIAGAGGKKMIIASVTDIITRNKEEFLITDSGELIRLDTIISLRQLQ